MLPKNVQKNIYERVVGKYVASHIATGIVGFLCAIPVIFIVSAVDPHAFDPTIHPLSLNKLMFPIILFIFNIVMVYLSQQWLKKTIILSLKQKDNELQDHAYKHTPSDDAKDDIWEG